jgi:hypothetical protein
MPSKQRRQLLFWGGSTLVAALLSNKIATASTQGDRPMNSSTDRDEIIDAVNRIGLMADRRDWQACRAAFSDRVETDYTSLNGGQPAAVNANDLINGWNSFFTKTFKTTQHLIGSHVVTITGDTAVCLSNFQAHHVYLDGQKGTWTLGGFYEHGLVRTSQGWRVNHMKMTWTWEHGTRPSA